MHAISRTLVRVSLAVALLALMVPAATAQQFNFVGSRFQGMGGAGVATVTDSTAQYWNPAALGFKKKGEWDVQLPVTVGTAIQNNALENVSEVVYGYDQASGVIEALQDGGGVAPTSGEIDSTIQWLTDLDALGDSAESVYGQVGIGLLGNVGHFAFGAISNTNITSYPDVDLANIGFDLTSFSDFLSAVSPNPGQLQTLKDQVDAQPSPFWDAANSAAFVDAFINAPGVDANAPNVQQLILDISGVVGDSQFDFANNTSGVVAVALSIQEIGLSYGYALPMPFFKPFDKKLSVGATAKYMMGISFARASLYTDGISGSGLGSIDGFDESTISSNFGLDLALDFRPFEFARIGLVARNVNAPKFSAGEAGDIRVRPAVRLGMSVTPIERLVLAMDVDLTDNRWGTVDWKLPDPTYSSRLISLGSEYTIPLGKPCALALRFGGYSNLTGSDNSNWAMTGGLGLKLWGFWLDMSAGGSFQKNRVRTGDTTYVNVPDRLNAGLGFKWQKSI